MRDCAGVEMPSASDEQRTAPRFDCGLKVCYRQVGDPTKAEYAADVLNLSTTGMGLAVASPLETGALLNLDLLDKHGQKRRTLLACVVHATTHDDQRIVGCNFIRYLTEEELQALLS
jgi:hypothetical protein